MFLVKFVSLILAFNLSTGQLSVPADIQSLKRPVALNDLRGTSADAVATVLAEAQVPGGIVSVYNDCAQPDQHLFSLNRGTLRDGLDYISGTDKSRNWTYSEGVIVVGFQEVESTLLKIIIADAAIEPNEALSLATQRLLGSAEVMDQIKKIGLVELNPPLGFSAVQKLGAEPLRTSLKREPKRLREKTLLQSLNYLASSRGEAVWHYEQFVCGKKASFRVSWSATAGS